MNEITSKNFVDKVVESVKHYNIEPTYWLNITKKAEMEIYVNEMPIFKAYDKDRYTTGESISHMILKSGVQKISYKIFSKEREVYVGIEIVEIDNKSKMKVSDEKLVKKYEKTVRMPENGVYEEEFTFNALVPYENKGWSEGQDLTKFDKKELETAVVAFYQRMWNIYNDKSKKEELFPLIIYRERESAISKYLSQKYLQERLEEYLLPYTNNTYEMQPLEKYKMVLYGEGKVVTLEQTSMDIRLRGNNSLWAKFQFDGEKSIRTNFPYNYLYLPKGKSLKDGLQIIR